MTQTHKLIVPLLSIGMFFSLATGPVSAQTPQEKREDLQQQWQEAVTDYQAQAEEFRQNRDERVAVRCELVTKRIDLYTSRYANNESRFISVYNKVYEVTDQVIARAVEAGKNTSELEAAVAELKLKADLARDEYGQLMTALEATEAYACGDSEGDFRQALTGARLELQETRQATLDARLYYQSEVRPAAQALLQQ